MIFQEIISECEFRFSRSGGKGGQHVNKVETKVELVFYPAKSEGLNEEEKNIILKKFESKLSKKGALIITSEKSRSQSRNKEDAVLKLKKMIEIALRKEKRRKATKMPKSVREKILKRKKINSEKKENRRKIRL